jgi:hypothetical protein
MRKFPVKIDRGVLMLVILVGASLMVLAVPSLLFAGAYWLYGHAFPPLAACVARW